MKFLNLTLAAATTLVVTQASAESYFNRKANGVKVYDLILKQNVPEKALRRVFEFLDINGKKTVLLKDRDRDGRRIVTLTEKVTIKDNYASIIDYSKPSNEPRLYLMNLKTGGVEKFLVAHGKNSGANIAEAFSNSDRSNKSSLGIYIGGETYGGRHGKSLRLHGIEASNSDAMLRDIVIHAANYVSYDFIKRSGRIGRSLGCPAVSPGVIQRVISTMQDGSVIYGYHKDLMSATLKNPSLQSLTKKPVDNSDKRDLPGEESESKTPSVIPLPVPRPAFLNAPNAEEKASPTQTTEPETSAAAAPAKTEANSPIVPVEAAATPAASSAEVSKPEVIAPTKVSITKPAAKVVSATKKPNSASTKISTPSRVKAVSSTKRSSSSSTKSAASAKVTSKRAVVSSSTKRASTPVKK